MLVFAERGKPKYLKKNLMEQKREPKTNLTLNGINVGVSNCGGGGGTAIYGLHGYVPL